MDSSSDEVVALLEAGDLAGLRRRYWAGGLSHLSPALGGLLYKELGARLDRNDTNGVWALLIERGIVAAPAWWGEEDEKRRRAGAAWIGLLPLVILLALAAIGLGRCGDDDDRGTGATGVTVEGPTTTAPSTATTDDDATTSTTGRPTTTTGRTASTSTTARATTTTARPTATTSVATPAPDSLLGRLAADPQFSTLAGLLQSSGLAAQLTGAGPFTVFAPTNTAIAALPPQTLAALQGNAAALRSVLGYHVVAGNLTSAALTSGTLPTLGGEAITIAVGEGTIDVNSARITQPDVTATNGVTHGIDEVLLPSDLQLGTAAAQRFTVFFDVGASTPNAASAAALAQATAAAQAAPAGATVILTGFADLSGDPVSNLTLSEERAVDVRTTLSAANPGLGYLTNAKGDTEAGADAAQARRVDISVG